MTRLKHSGPNSARHLLDRILENPNLVNAVRDLPGQTLGKLINAVGLEDAAELVALASSEQLEAVFDEDLWQIDPTDSEERFDPARFALWLRAFADAGDAALVRRLLELPVDLLVLAVQRAALVIDSVSFASELTESDDELEQVEKALDSCLTEEWEEFHLVARSDEAWDDIVQALFALDRDHHQLLREILERCAVLSSEWIRDNGGLFEVLTSDEMLEADVRADRDDRRAQQGYVSAADARAFLEFARTDTPNVARDATTNAYFRQLERKPQRARARGNEGQADSLLKLLAAANLESTASEDSPGKPGPANALERIETLEATGRLLDRSLAQLREFEASRYQARLDELAYLVNIWLAAPQHRALQQRPVEALEAVVEVVNRGLERELAQQALTTDAAQLRAAVAILAASSADRLFRRGFALA